MEPESHNDNNDMNDNEKSAGYVHVDPGTVRRKLFQEEALGSGEPYPDFASVANMDDQGSQMVAKNWSSKEKKVVNQKESKSCSKEKNQEEIIMLLISHCKNASLTKQIKERARFLFDNVEVVHCYPEYALRYCCTHAYNLIFIDLNGDCLGRILQLATSIRISTLPNQETALIGMKHMGTIKEEYWCKFGISEIVYGPIYHTIIDQIIEKWMGTRVKREIAFNANDTSTSLKKEEAVAQDLQRQNDVGYSREGWSSRNASPAPACDSTEQITAYTATEVTLSKSDVSLPDTTTYFNEQPSIPGTAYYVGASNCVTTYSNSCFSSLSHPATVRPTLNEFSADTMGSARSTNVGQPSNNGKTNSGWNMIQQILDLHQSGQRGSETKPKTVTNDPASLPGSLPKVVSSQPMVQTTNQGPLKSFSAQPMFTTPAIPPNTSYVVTGKPGTSNMKISLVPEDYVSHSNKERERRERIKQSCDDLRRILPKPLMANKRQDMATVLELTVHYLKAIEKCLPTVIHQQLYQSFQNLDKGTLTKKKRKAPTAPVSSSYNGVSSKHPRIQPSPIIHGCTLGEYSAPTYLPQILPGHSQQPTTIGYYPSVYHQINANSYLGSFTHAPSPTIFGSAIGQMPHLSISQIDHDMHTRQQYYNEGSAVPSGISYYLSGSAGARDTSNNSTQKEIGHQNHFCNP